MIPPNSRPKLVARRGAPLAGLARALLLQAALVSAAHAALEGDFRLERIGTRHGLNAEIVTSIHRDRTGFLWIGTRDGLILYDGYSAKVFDHEITDPASISDNSIRTIYEDREGSLWLGTNTGGLNRYDRASGRFEKYRHDSADSRSISHDSVYAILQDREGALWVGTQSGLNRLDRATGTFDRFMSEPENELTPGHDYVHWIHEDRAGYLWVATVGGGLSRREPATGRFARFRHDPHDPRTVRHDSVFSVLEDATGELWVGTQAGVDRFDRASGSFEHFPAGADDTAGLSYPLVTSLAPGPPGTLYVGTWGGGMHELEIASRTFRTRSGHGSQQSGDPLDRIACLHADDRGAIWAGTWGGGLVRVRPSSSVFETLREGQPPRGLSVGDTISLGVGPDGTLWMGTFGGGLNRRDSRGDIRQLGQQPAPAILAIHVDPDGRAWLGTMMGVARLDPESGETTFFTHDPRRPASLGPGYVAAILRDSDGVLWIGTGEGGLQRLRPDGASFDHFTHAPRDPSTLSDVYVTALYEDRRGALWVGTRSGGLNRCDRLRMSCQRFVVDPGDERAIGHHWVTSLAEDRDGRLWVGTGGGGLNRFEPPTEPGQAGGFSRVTERDGLADDNVMGIASDDDGSLWLSTQAGLTRLDPETGRIVNFGRPDGLLTLEFNPGAVARDAASIYFGTPAGVVVLPAGRPFPESETSTTALTSITTLAGPLVSGGPVADLRRLELPYGEVVSFEFAVLDYDEEDDRYRYAYRFSGVSDDWTDLGSRRQLTFADLRPGRYELTIRGRNARGAWSATQPLELRIVPPFWMTAWFRLAVFGSLALALLLGHRARLSALERRNRELVALQDERERALREARASEEKLQITYGELRSLTRRLEASKEDERKRIARELHDEMGQILSATKINLQILPSLPDAAVRERRIVDSVALVDRMIGQVRALSLDLHPPFLDELGLVLALRGYVEAVGRRSGIDIRVVADVEPERLPEEVEIHAFRLVQESVTNVVRHSGASQATVTVERRPHDLRLSVRDDGRGFAVAETLERATHGQHLGLLGMRERVGSLGGRFEIDSAPGRGTEIRIELSLRH